MAIFMLTSWFPFNKAIEVGNLVTKYTKLPDYITKWRTFSTADGPEGMKVYNLIYVKDDKIVEAELYVARLMREFTDGINGYTYKVEVVLSGTDTRKSLDVKLL
ncbi:MAG: hypothetical protein ACFE94_06090 [Candidatus Hodarchaeota archaeon]